MSDLLGLDVSGDCSRLLHQVRAQRRPTGPSAQALPIPDDPAEFLARVYWPHISEVGEDGEPIPANDLNPMQLDFLARRAGWRLGPGGQPQGGRDIVCKARRVRMTSLGLGLILWAMLRLPGTRYVVVAQIKDRMILGEIRDQILYAVERLPEQWRGSGPWHVGWQVRLGGSRLDLTTAGHAAKVAAKVGRSGRIDGLLMTEVREYAHPETLFSAAAKCVPPSGWIIAESTPSRDPDSWHTRQWHLTGEGRGQFDRAHFWPWWQDPLKRIPRVSETYRRVMDPAFAAQMDRLDLDQERALRLDDEQIAYRRAERCTGERRDRMEARAENPESVEDASVVWGEGWLDPLALERAYSTCREPVERHRLSELMSVSYFVDPDAFCQAGRRLAIGFDNAALWGRDLKAGVVRDLDTLEQVATIHGRALDSDAAEGLRQVLDRLVGLAARRYILVVERNRAQGLLVECERLRLALWGEMVEDRPVRGRPKRGARPGQRRHRAGVVNSGRSRPQFLDALVQAVEGSPEREPVVYRDRYLVDELAGLQERDQRIAAGPGLHDDLAMADAICLWVARYEGRRAQVEPALALGPARGSLGVPT